MQIINYVAVALLLIIVILLIMPPLHKENFEMLGEDWKLGAKIATIQAKTLEASNIGETIYKQIIDQIYPVGSIMLRYDLTNPSTLPWFKGTTWSRIGDETNRVLTVTTASKTAGTLIAGSTTSGSTSITLAESNLPKHSHTVGGTTNSSGNHIHTIDSVGTHSHDMTFYNDDFSNTGDKKSYSTKLLAGKAYPGLVLDVAADSGNPHGWHHWTGQAGSHTHIVKEASGHVHTLPTSTGIVGSGTTFSHSHPITPIPPGIVITAWRREENKN